MEERCFSWRGPVEMSTEQDFRFEMAKPIHAEVKLTIHTQERFFGPGICELLEKIRETGSIQAASRAMNMSYTKAWKILNRAEKEMGRTLITRVNGGKKGGSSTLTEDGIQAVYNYREMERKLAAVGNVLLKEYGGSFLPVNRNGTSEAEIG